jgi:hypothetical protein
MGLFTFIKNLFSSKEGVVTNEISVKRFPLTIEEVPTLVAQETPVKKQKAKPVKKTSAKAKKPKATKKKSEG